MVERLSGEVSTFKVGSRLFTMCGPGIVRRIQDAGCRVFLDLKFHDIPTTVADAGVEAARLGVFMFNVHVSGGETMMRRCVERVRNTCGSEGLATPLILGVTLLTSICEETLRDDLGVTRSLQEQVLHMAGLARGCGLDGVVASAREAATIRGACGSDFVIVTPGIRPAWSSTDDQSRVASPAAALAAGSDYLVVGRPVTGADDPLAAVRAILDEMAG
jgi:orotidine-5'-phosphate decarboxylase